MATPPVTKRPSLYAWFGGVGLTRTRGRYLLLAAFILATVVVLPRRTGLQLSVRVGEVWQRPDVVAPLAFPVRKSPERYRREQTEAQQRVPPVYRLRPDASETGTTRLDEYLRQLETCLKASPAVGTECAEGLQSPLEYKLYDELRRKPELWQSLQAGFRRTVRDIYAAGLADRRATQTQTSWVALRPSDAEELLVEAARLTTPDDLGRRALPHMMAVGSAYVPFARAVLAQYLKPNYELAPSLFEQEKQLAADRISPTYGRIEAGATIIRRGERVTPELAEALASLEQELDARTGGGPGWAVFAGQLAMLSLFTALMVYYLRLNRPYIFSRNRKISLLFAAIWLMTALLAGVASLGTSLTGVPGLNLLFLVPLSMAPILVTIFFDDRVGFFSNIGLSLLSGFIVTDSFELFFIQFLAGSLAVFNLKVLRRRQQFFTTAGTLLLTYWLAYLSYHLYLEGTLVNLQPANLILFFLNVTFTLATYPLIYLFERVFRITSDLTFIELLDTGHPALKELALKAPGTYQHSLQVANIAEAVAVKLGANALQVRVGALFHDIGKVFQPEYFTENQGGGASPHERLSPQRSAEIIINHVAYGEELAHRHGLPREVIDYIRTHHGNSRVEYFYRTYQLENPYSTIDEQQFRYPGPLPSSREMAILMLADACEAASRSLKKPTEEDLRTLVENIVTGKINDHQLAEARITFRELHILKGEILRILTSIYHTRVEYPTAGARVALSAERLPA